MAIDRLTRIAAVVVALAAASAAGISTLAQQPAPEQPSLTIAIDGGYSGWSGSEIRQRAELGAPVTRHEWDLRHPVDEQDDVVEVAARTIRTRIHALLGGNELTDPGHYRRWVIAFLRRYGVSGTFWAEHPALDASRFAITSVELGNEPYYGGMSVRDYANTVRPALKAIRRLAPRVSVMLGANVRGDETHWVDRLSRRIPNLGSLIDGLALHPYWYGNHPATPGDESPFGRIETLRRRMNALGLRRERIFITEYGQSTAACGAECVSEAEQASHLAAMIDAVHANPHWRVGMLTVFQLRDRGTESGDRELQFGLLRENGTPKPSYRWVRAAIRRSR